MGLQGGDRRDAAADDDVQRGRQSAIFVRLQLLCR
jgi:hypothetical protein